jgi:hypothetical protein
LLWLGSLAKHGRKSEGLLLGKLHRGSRLLWLPDLKVWATGHSFEEVIVR